MRLIMMNRQKYKKRQIAFSIRAFIFWLYSRDIVVRNNIFIRDAMTFQSIIIAIITGFGCEYE